jgi:hypothetical protein
LADYRRVCPAIVVLLVVIACSGDAFAFNYSLFPDTGNLVHEFFKGSRHEVRVHVIRGEEQGPTVLIVGAIHGDEPATHLAVERYTQVTVKRGSLIVVPRLNRPASVAGTRHGTTGDMNRLFGLPETEPAASDRGVVSLAKLLIGKSDYVLNLHQGGGFYAPSWINRDRNPSRWGQTYVIDASVFEPQPGTRIDLMAFAASAAERSNARIRDPLYRFHVRNTDTERKGRVGKEQQTSLTFFAASKASKMALGIEATKNCSRAQAVDLLVTATDSVLQEAGLMLEHFPSERGDFTGKVAGQKAVNPRRHVAALGSVGTAALPLNFQPGR